MTESIVYNTIILIYVYSYTSHNLMEMQYIIDVHFIDNQ